MLEDCIVFHLHHDEIKLAINVCATGYQKREESLVRIYQKLVKSDVTLEE